MERIAIGPLLRESVVVASRHWVTFLVLALVLALAFLANAALITRCLMSPYCLPIELASTVMFRFDYVMWEANRIASWLICGLAIQRLLASEGADNPGGDADRRRRRLRGYSRCVLYLASGSLAGFAIRFVLPDLPDAEGWTYWGVFAVRGAIVVPIWAYLDARFALFTASQTCSDQPEGFAESWRRVRGSRRNLFLVFLGIELAAFAAINAVPSPYVTTWLMPIAAELETLLAMPKDFLLFRLFDMATFALYLAVANTVCAGAFFAVYRRYAASRPEASVFD